MASVILNFFIQLKLRRQIKLFKSHNVTCQDGDQARDFVYVKDVVDVLVFMMKNQKNNGIYNIGTGIPRSFQEIADILQKNLGTNFKTEYFKNPYKGYQNHTQADISSSKLRKFDKII